MFPYITKAVTNAVSMLVIATVVLTAENTAARPDSLERYHTLLAQKYGFSSFEVTTTQVTNPDRIQLIRKISDDTLHQLVTFASNIEANEFSYKNNNEFWRLSNGNSVLSYTFSIDIMKHGTKLYDYHCFAILANSENSGFTMGCSAYEITRHPGYRSASRDSRRMM